MGKLFSRLIGALSKFECGKHQVGSVTEVRISIKGEKDQSGRGSWKDIFPGSNACLLIRLGCLAWFLF